ncbi:hypothetical protein [Caldisalinibacter kiritimatiensis]|uniref:Uncharacterized protein n=1 Tax=Caldisalinibacter kiritimatiensis TaxID=1304284 RepID=R1AUD6_9FIRM|nr:hypothetical protein [Caldisalinibacter kiritimatiensis]EOD00778.1 hypothetical protein L21TH_1149 [Caldisalinibacter kiritimatiensis]
MISFIVSVLVFAAAFAFLLAWGYVKQQKKTQELLDKLYKKIETKIIKQLKKKEYLTKNELMELIKGTKASLFWSNNKIQVNDPKLVTDNILNKLLEKGVIVEVLNKGPKKYKLNK